MRIFIAGASGAVGQPLVRRLAEAGHEVVWLAVVVGNARARRFYEKHGWYDAGDLPYEVTAGGTAYISPCRRYEKRVSTAGTTRPGR